MQSSKAFRSKKLLAAAIDHACTSCGISSGGGTVAAHANSVALGKGTGIKAPDYYVAYVCGTCHDLIDGRIGHLNKEQKMAMWMAAHLKTVALWFNEGIVKVCD